MKIHTNKLKQIGLLLSTSLVLISCSEKGEEAIKELKSKAEEKLVEQAGEGEVAIALMQKQYLELKERLVRIKTLTRTFERRAAELDAKKLLLEQKEGPALEELKNFAVVYEEAKADIQMLKEELEVAKSLGGLDDGLGVENPLSKRMDTVKELTEKMRQKLDRAEALLDVGEIEKDI
jgi:hypothetical protein